ncbi:MAG: hypothetical protein ORN27_09750 [Rhodoluna sp.]|nr:hypothetical protein [Rhodoluna sp.]
MFLSVPARADDSIDLNVPVLSTEGAPSIKAGLSSPIGKKSDGAQIKVKLTSLEANRPVLFKVTPLPDGIAKFTSDSSGGMQVNVELPYGLTPGTHEITADTVFGVDETPATYTVGQIFVSDFGLLTNSDGSYPKGTRPVTLVLPNSAEAFQEAPKYQLPRGTIRVSEPQLRVSQGFLPALKVGMSFENSLNAPTSLKARVTLFTFYGAQIGKPFYTNLESMAPGEQRSFLMDFGSLPAVGFFKVHTQLLLPDNFTSTKPVQTSIDSVFTVFPTVVSALTSLALFIAFTLSWFLRKRPKRQVIQ